MARSAETSYAESICFPVSMAAACALCFVSRRKNLLLLAFIFTFGVLCQQHPKIPEDVTRLHHILSAFALKGQTTLELFAPLSTISGRAAVLLAVVSTVCWPLFGMLAVPTLKQRHDGIWDMCLVAGWTLATGLGRESSALDMVQDIADACLCLSLLLSTYPCRSPRSPRIILFFGSREALVLVSMSLGCNLIDGSIAYALLLVERMKQISEQIADVERPVSVTLRNASMHVVSWALLWPLLVGLLIGGSTPCSESLAWGNYNLRFFAAPARRAMSPFAPIQASMEKSVLPFGLYPGMAYTFYVPGAGFLWSDSMVWNQSLPAGSQSRSVEYSGHAEQHHVIDASARVYFQDRYAERYPWVVEVVSGFPPNKFRRRTAVSSSDRLRVFDPNASKYLCVIQGTPVVSEAGYAGGEEADTGRVRVGSVQTLREPQPQDCNWSAYHDPRVDIGIAFYSSAHDCTLATTFRTVPDADGAKYNDTVQQLMNLKIEVSCTKGASDLSSRLHLIDRAPQSKLGSRPSRHMPEKRFSNTLKTSYMWAWWNLEARLRLGSFRRHYWHVQGVPDAIQQLHDRRQTSASFSFGDIIIGLYCTVWIVRVLCRRRHLRSDWAARDGDSSFGGVFITVHLMANYVLGQEILSSSRVPALVSLYGLAQYFL